MNKEWLFNADIRMDSLNKIGNRLDCFSKHIDWEAFRPLLNHVRDNENRKPQDRKAYDVVHMSKILILQELYALSDEEAEY
ncbi:MAG: hypothetical protein Q4G68_03815 [Planctomycetia bacterium]|nr:hypothetical protein [Planctomycetia bacterium]